MNNKRNCNELLVEFKEANRVYESEKLEIVVEDGKDTYNISAPFEIDGQVVLAARVEARDSEFSEVRFFNKKDNQWVKVENSPVFQLQDPFVTKIDGEVILGGVEVFEDENVEGLNYRTIFMRGTSLDNLTRFACGPDRMKDIRLLKLNDNRILVLTRPQGEIGGRGTIGYTFINSLEELTQEVISSATLLDDQFYSEEWGGANELHLLEDGMVGVLSHIAKFDEEGNRHYYSSVFKFNPNSYEYTPMKLIATRSNFGEGAAKRPDLIDVIFSGGLIRRNDGKAELYCGVSDAEAHKILINDPFNS